MNMITLIVLGVVVLLAVVLYFSYHNREVSLRKEFEAQQGKIESVYDTMWKTLKQEAEVTEQYRKAFERIYPELIAGRYSGDNSQLMKFIHEANPNFDVKLYDKLMQVIESQRAYFASAQQRILDIIREHDTLRESLPSAWFVGSRPKLEYEVISSSITKEVVETRRDEDIKLFNE